MEPNNDGQIGGRSTEYLTPTEFVAKIRRIYANCDAWIAGTQPDDSLRAEFNRVRETHWAIRGLDDLPEDFDWKSISQEQWDESDHLEQLLHNALRLMTAVETAIETLKQYPVEQHSSVLRAHLLGQSTSRNRFDPSCTP